MGTVISKRINAASLMETIVALVIILVVFGIVTSFFVQISLTSFSLKKIKAIQVIEAYAAETDEKKAFFDEEVETGGMISRREIVEENGEEGVTRVRFGVYASDGTLIAQQQRVYILK